MHSGLFKIKILSFLAKAYQAAIEQGADVIECDVTVTRDKQLICLHENNLKHTTNVARFTEFADRKTSYNISNEYYDHTEYEETVDDWFSVDFTLAELKLLRKVQNNDVRDPRFDGQFEISTLEELIQIVQNANRTIGLHLETKSPRWINSLPLMANTTVEKILVDVLNRYGYKKNSDPCFLQSFEEDSLYRLKELTDLPLVRLIYVPELNMSDARLKVWAESFYGIGPWKEAVRPFWSSDKGYKNNLGEPTDLVERAHRYGLLVHAYTFRNEDKYLAWDFNQDPVNELEMYIDMGVDGLFTDFPETLKRYLDSVYHEQDQCISSSEPTTPRIKIFTLMVVLGYLIELW